MDYLLDELNSVIESIAYADDSFLLRGTTDLNSSREVLCTRLVLMRGLLKSVSRSRQRKPSRC